MAQPAVKYYSEEDYLAMERESAERHTFYAGEIFTMAGASYEHNVIEDNIRVSLGNFLKGKPCRSFGSNLRVHVLSRSFYSYPDAFVICNEPRFLDNIFDTVTNPVLIIEILSDGTADFDKGLKFDLYRSIDTLQEYLLVDSREVHVMHYSKNANGSWTMQEYNRLAGRFFFTSIGFTVTIEDCYDGLNLTSEKEA